MTTGIYGVFHNSGRCYIGSAKNCENRFFKGHLKALRKGRHHSRFLQRAWNKYGEDQFWFRVFLVCSEEDLFFYEQLLLDNLRPAFNVNPSACGTRGLVWTEESKNKLKARVLPSNFGESIRQGVLANTTAEERSEHSRRARSFWTEASRLQQIKSLTGKKHSNEVKAKRAASLKGRIVSQETRAKIAAANVGRKHSEETKKKMRGRQVFEVTRQKLRERPFDQSGGWPKGEPRPVETKAKLSAALKGCIWITNGSTSTTHDPSKLLPEGWWRGKPRFKMMAAA